MRATIVLLPGDGIGPEVVAAARVVLGRVAEIGGHRLSFREASIGGQAIDQTGDPLPAATVDACRAADAILLGAVGGPRWSDPEASVRPEQGLLRLRQALGLFANLRPARAYPALADLTPFKARHLSDVDLLFVRELTGGIYFGPRQETDDGSAWDTMLYSQEEVVRVAHVAFRAARQRRRKVTSVDKANVLASMRLWRKTVSEVARDYPDIELEHLLVDACALHLLSRPADFDVVLAGNLFGDILSDETAIFAGSLGMLPSASLGHGRLGLYEPIHGSAPDLARRDLANPIATILSAAMLLRTSLLWHAEAEWIEQAVAATIADGARTADLGNPDKPLSTTAMTQQILDRLTAIAASSSEEAATSV